MSTATGVSGARTAETAQTIALRVLAAISFCHLLNDMLQSTIPALYPVLKASYRLDFGQIGLMALAGQLTASLLQPFIGLYTDKRPMPFSLPVGMSFTLFGLLMLAVAHTFALIVVAVALVGIGSAVFHPESSRVARLASGGQHGLAQSLFQVGGNFGTSLGPLLAAFIVVPRGQGSIAWFSCAALLAIIVLTGVGAWHKAHRQQRANSNVEISEPGPGLSRRRVASALGVLIALMFSKFFYLSSLTAYYTFFLMTRFHVPVRTAQLYLFVFLAAVAVGTIVGGPVGDRIGRKHVIWWSILGILPFTLALPYVSLFWTAILTVIIGLVLASAFSAIVVYAQQLTPGRVGAVSGLFFGLAFGLGGIGAAFLGWLADQTSITTVYRICSFLPAIGLLTAFLPNLEPSRRRKAAD